MEEFDLNPKSRVWAPGWPSWKDAEEVGEIMDYLNRREAQAREEREARERAEQEAKARKEQEAKAAREQAKAQQAQAQAQAQQQAQAQAQAQSAGPTAGETAQAEGPEWYYAINNQQYGPVSEAELRSMGIGPDTLVWNENVGGSWIAASQVPALADLFVRTSPDVAHTAVAVSAQNYASTHAVNVNASQDKLMSGAYNFGIGGAVCTVIAIIVCFVNAEYYDSQELMAILAVCALPSVILSEYSLAAANKCVNSCKLGDTDNALKQRGLSMGLGIGAMISAVVGAILAIKDFSIV